MTFAAKRGQASWRLSRFLAVGTKRAMLSRVSSVMPSPSSGQVAMAAWAAADSAEMWQVRSTGKSPQRKRKPINNEKLWR